MSGKKESKSTYTEVQKLIIGGKKAGIPLNINDLPVELLTYIFGFLDSKDVLNTALVCQGWNTTLTEQSLWRQFAIRDFNLDPDKLKDGFGKNEYLLYRKNQQKKTVLEKSIKENQGVLDDEATESRRIMAQYHPRRITAPVVSSRFSPLCVGITTISTGGGMGLGLILGLISSSPPLYVFSFVLGCGGIGNFIGQKVGEHCEISRIESTLAKDKAQVAQINEESPLLPPTSMVMQ